MSTLHKDEKYFRGVNPIVRKLSKVAKVSDKDLSFAGVTKKTVYFLVATLVGFVGYYAFSKYLATGSPLVLGDYNVYVPQLILAVISLALVVVAPFVAWHFRKTLSITGAVCCVAQGILISWATKTFAGDYNEIIILSLIATLALTVSLLMLYKHKIVKLNQKVRLVTVAVIFTVAITTIILFIAYFVPGARPFVNSISDNTALTYGISIAVVVVATLLLMCDFNYIEKCAETKMPEKYEWLASFGLSFTVIWIYFKVFDLFVKVKR